MTDRLAPLDGPPTWVPPHVAIMDAAVAADRLVPLGDERLDAMLAGGLRATELCGVYADLPVGLPGVRRVIASWIRRCAVRTGPVLYFGLTTAAAEARDAALSPLAAGGTAQVVAPEWRPRSMPEITHLAQLYADAEGLRLVVIDQLDAIIPDNPYAAGWEHESQITRDLKALARWVATPVIVTCTAVAPTRGRPRDLRPLPIDPLVAAADVLLLTNGRHNTEPIKNRNGVTQLHW
jgi:hypothetical protein